MEKLQPSSLRVGRSPLIDHLSRRLYEANPDIRLRFQVRDSEGLYDEIDRRIVDVGFSYLYREMPTVSSIPLFSEPFVVLSTEKITAAKNGTVSPGDLDPDAEVFVRWWGAGYLKWHEEHWDIHQSQRLSTSSSYMQLSFLGSLGKWGIMPYSLARREADGNTRFMYRLNPEPPGRVCHLLTHKLPRPGINETLKLFGACLDKVLHADLPGIILPI